jgi:hypothetical protein
MVILGALVSCGSQPVKNSNSAILQNTKHKDAKASMSAMFKAINKEELKVGSFTTPNQATHYVNPGLVYIYAYVTLSGEEFVTVNAADYIFQAELKSGETYSLKPTIKGKCIEIYLESKSGEKIGPFVQPWFDFDSPQRILSVMSVESNISSSKKCGS